MLFCTFGQFAVTVHVKIPKTFHTERPFAVRRYCSDTILCITKYFKSECTGRPCDPFQIQCIVFEKFLFYYKRYFIRGTISIFGARDLVDSDRPLVCIDEI